MKKNLLGMLALVSTVLFTPPLTVGAQTEYELSETTVNESGSSKTLWSFVSNGQTFEITNSAKSGKNLDYGSDNYSSDPKGSDCIKWSSSTDFKIKVPSDIKISAIRISGYSDNSSNATNIKKINVGSTAGDVSDATAFPAKDKTNKATATYSCTLPVVADGNDETNNIITVRFESKALCAVIYLIAESSSKSYTLDFNNYTWKSLCLDFDATMPDGVEAYTGVLNSDESVVVTTKVGDTVLPKNTPVVVKNVGESTSYTLVEGTATTTNTSYTNDLQGVTEQTNLTDLAQDGKAVLTFGVDANGAYGFRVPANEYIAANKVYIYVSATAGQVDKAIGLSADGTSAINAIKTTTATADAAAYNMMGQRVGANAKGLIIKGGRKYIVK